MAFRQEWVASGLPQYPYNRVIRNYLRELREKPSWLSATSAKVKAGQLKPPTKWARFKKTLSFLPRMTTRSRSARTVPVLVLLSASLILSSCAVKAPRLSCYETACGDVCCNNDGRICPACWEEEIVVLETSPGSFDSMPGIIPPTYTFEPSIDTGCYWVKGEIHYVIDGVEVDAGTFQESFGDVEGCVLPSDGE